VKKALVNASRYFPKLCVYFSIKLQLKPKILRELTFLSGALFSKAY